MKILKLTFVIATMIFSILSTGCSVINEQAQVYIPPPMIVQEKPLLTTLFIEKIRNDQPREETLPFSPNDDMWILIPLCFYSAQQVDPVVRRNFFQNSLESSMQRLFLTDLKASGIATLVATEDSKQPRIKKWSENYYRLELVLKHAVWNRNITAYGLSYPGTLLWTLGLPVSYGNVQLEIEAILYPPGKDAKPVGRTTIKEEESCVESIYDQLGYNPSISETKMAEIFPEVAKKLRLFIVDNIKKQK